MPVPVASVKIIAREMVILAGQQRQIRNPSTKAQIVKKLLKPTNQTCRQAWMWVCACMSTMHICSSSAMIPPFFGVDADGAHDSVVREWFLPLPVVVVVLVIVQFGYHSMKGTGGRGQGSRKTYISTVYTMRVSIYTFTVYHMYVYIYIYIYVDIYVCTRLCSSRNKVLYI